MGYTCKIDTTKFKVTVDGKDRRGLITFDELHEMLKEFIPARQLKQNPEYRDFIKGIYPKYWPEVDMTLKQLIDCLTFIYEKEGDMPFLLYDPDTLCFYNRVPSHLDVIPKYHLVGCNTRHQTINIKNSKALILEI